MVLQIDEAAAAAASLEAWASAPAREREGALGLLELAVSPPATHPAHDGPAWAPPAEDAAPFPPIWERLQALPDPVGVPRATSTPLPRPARRRRRLRRREWKPLERVSV